MNDKIREAFEKWVSAKSEMFADWWEFSNTDHDKFYIWTAYESGYKSQDAEISRLKEEIEALKCCGNCLRNGHDDDCLFCYRNERLSLNKEYNSDNWQPKEKK